IPVTIDVALCSSNRRLTKPLHNATVPQLQLVALVHAITLAHRLRAVNCELMFRPPKLTLYSRQTQGSCGKSLPLQAARDLKATWASSRCHARRVRTRRGLYMPSRPPHPPRVLCTSLSPQKDATNDADERVVSRTRACVF